MDFIDGPPAYRDWNGLRWYYSHKMRRYRSNTGIMLAQAVWAAEHGPIPDGFDVHHVDEDTTNDDIGNLALVAQSEHAHHHAARNGAKAKGGDAGARAMWAKRQPEDRICGFCAETYQSRSTYSSFCSGRCKAAFRRRRQREALGLS